MKTKTLTTFGDEIVYEILSQFPRAQVLSGRHGSCEHESCVAQTCERDAFADQQFITQVVLPKIEERCRNDMLRERLSLERVQSLVHIPEGKRPLAIQIFTAMQMLGMAEDEMFMPDQKNPRELFRLFSQFCFQWLMSQAEVSKSGDVPEMPPVRDTVARIRHVFLFCNFGAPLPPDLIHLAGRPKSAMMEP
ncbi:MAG: hypothetical protein EBZ69_02300 [Alphaproteobacteria bacterium]|nr:hypothetical protein [Alphaproteobacteria bacterium]NDC55634.1 hypothetical protein [Alphaproteobacteria bacterium]NDG04217.1 hypothetical protein [Alphaproteobacteria bacterium]